MKPSTKPFLLIFNLLLSINYFSYAQISGSVFSDFNGNGVKENSATFNEVFVAGILVKAFNSSNIQLGTTKTTDEFGAYSFSAIEIPASTIVRIEFSGSATGDNSTFNGLGNGTNVQFVTAPSSTVNFALSYPGWYSNTTNPWLVTSSFTTGNSSATGAGESGTFPNLFVRAFNASGDGTATTNTTTNNYTGSVYGLAYQRETRKLFTSAYFKRHYSLGPGGIGGIYTTNINQSTGSPSNPSLFVDVSTIGINVGSDVAGRVFNNAPGWPSDDPNAFAIVGKNGIGDIDISDDGKNLFLINMFQSKLHRIFINNPAVTPVAANVTEWAIPTPTLPGVTTSFRPMAIKVWKNRIFIGGVCVKEISANQSVADTAGMSGLVYEFNEMAGTFTTVLTFPLTYKKGYTDKFGTGWQFRNHYWSPWQNSTSTSVLQFDALSGAFAGTFMFYGQPMLSDIEFDVNGDMIIGLRDRWGDQMGWVNNYPSLPNPGINSISNAEMLRAGNCNGSIWTIENNTNICSGTANGGANLPGLTGYFNTDNIGPGTGTANRGMYYFNESPATFNHQMRYLGGLTLFAGSNTISSTAIDPWAPGIPSTAYNSSGFLHTYNQTISGNNAGTVKGGLLNGLRLINDNYNLTPGKTGALGDLEFLVDPQPIQIGNRIWNDLDGDGIQDANETVPPVPAGTIVALRSPGLDGTYGNADDQTWTTTTNATGNYYFDNTNVLTADNRKPADWLGVSGILPGYNYRLELTIPPAYSVTKTDIDLNGLNNIDNDATALGVIAIIPFNTNDITHNYDIGLSLSTALPARLEFTAIKKGSEAKLSWKVTQEDNVAKYVLERSTDGINFFTINSQNKNGSTTYQYTDIQAAAKVNYYRVSIVDNDGRKSYSEIRIVIFNTKGTMAVFPNPGKDKLNIQLPDSWQGKGISILISNPLGQIVINKQLENAGQVTTIDIVKIPNGVYNIRVINSDGIFVNSKLLINK
jgi:hypothetical protein